MKEGWEQLDEQQLAQGYFFDHQKGCWVCLDCLKEFDQQEIFAFNGKFYTAQKAVQLHQRKEHPNRLHKILEEEKKLLSLTEKQEQLLERFAAGMTDAQIAKEFGVSASTVRHQRFVFRERAKSAKLYLAVWQMVQQGREQLDKGEELIEIHGGATMVDARYEITQQEEQKILSTVFASMQPLRLKTFPPKEKKKVVILRTIAKEFEEGIRYSEVQVNEILKDIYPDYVTLRRYLIEYGYLERTRDGSAYWKK